MNVPLRRFRLTWPYARNASKNCSIRTILGIFTLLSPALCADQDSRLCVHSPMIESAPAWRTSSCARNVCENTENPADRRFHSETNSCPACGPRLSLVDANGQAVGSDPILEAIRLLRQGKVLAVKGIGGFHLACDALNETAVAALRDRKGRARSLLQ